MLKLIEVKFEDIYVPTARRKEMAQDKIDAIVEAMLEGEEEKPIRVREGKGRYVLVQGINRLEAGKAVGEERISAYLVQAPKF